MPHFLKTLRFFEAFLMTGFFMIAMIFAVPELTLHVFGRSVLTFFAVYFLILSIYAFNAFCGKKYDFINERLAFLQNTHPANYFVFSFLFFIVSVFLFLFIDKSLLFYVVAIEFLWIVYSLPFIGLKNFPFVGTALHFITQILHFNLVFAVFAPVSLNSVLISIYFALLFAAGHLHHEVIDHEADLKSSIKTGAVIFGLRVVSNLSFSVFTFTSFYITVLYILNIIPLFVVLPLVVAFLFHLMFFLKTHSKFPNDSLSRLYYQKAYRFFYFFGCVVIVVMKLFTNN